MVYPLPVFGVRDGKFTSHYSRTYVEAAQLDCDVPKMSDAQWEALDMLADVCRELHTAHDFGPGEMQILNNHVVYHARDAYDDAEAPDRKRLLYRLWICPPSTGPCRTGTRCCGATSRPTPCAAASGATSDGEPRGPA